MISKYLIGGAVLAIVILGLSLKISMGEVKEAKRDLKDEVASRAQLQVNFDQFKNQAQQVAATNNILQEAKERIVYVDKIVTKEIIRYRDRVTNRCQLDNDWVRIHDQAATRLPENSGASGANEAGAGAESNRVDDAEALQVVTENYSLHYQCKAKVEALQSLLK
jgi:hypothetical protein